MKTLRSAMLLLAVGTASLHAQPQSEPENLRLGDMLALLVATYNGIADAAEAGGKPVLDKRLSDAETARLQRGLNHLHNELQSLVKPDGTLDTKRGAELLNALQQLKGGQHFDFVKAEAALQNARHGANGALIDQLLGAAVGGGDAGLSAEVAHYKRLAAGQTGGAYRTEALIDLLKLVYAERKLDTVNEARERQAHELIAQTLQQDGISEAHYEQIRTLLAETGGPFKADYKAWNAARGQLLRPAANPQEIDRIIESLQNRHLTPEQREQILRALQR